MSSGYPTMRDLIYKILAITILFAASCKYGHAQTTANQYDDYAHFGIMGAVSGLFSLACNNPYEKHPLYAHDRKTGEWIYLGDDIVPKKYDILPGLIAGTVLEMGDQLLHPNGKIYWDHVGWGEAGTVLAAGGVGLIWTCWKF